MKTYPIPLPALKIIIESTINRDLDRWKREGMFRHPRQYDLLSICAPPIVIDRAIAVRNGEPDAERVYDVRMTALLDQVHALDDAPLDLEQLLSLFEYNEPTIPQS